jgi:hypothetical protein
VPTVKDLKDTLVANKATWSVQPHLLDHLDLPVFHGGALADKLTLSSNVRPLDFKSLFAIRPNNPFVLERRLALNIVPDSLVEKAHRIGSAQVLTPGVGGAPPAGGPAVSVDWRNRWGWPWITNIRDQNGCEACWCFAAVALVEAMVRIEHCVWPWISEGDVHKGMGKHCCDCGNSEEALDWMKNNAAADPGCFAWPVTASGCSGCGGTGGSPYDVIAYHPTPDRAGRSVRIPAYTHIGSIVDQKTWIDTVGPIITYITVFQDFGSVGAGVYHKQPTIGSHPNTAIGGHLMLVVGYDDAKQCWIVKNSWGAGWGQSGFGRIGYGEADIDTYAKIGLSATNPDPWTKRRVHGGGMLESGNGALHRNFELVTTGPGAQLHHWWRDNSGAGFPWHAGVNFGSDAAACPTLISTTFNRNFESVHLTTNHRLHHWWFGQPGGPWNDGGVFGPIDAAGIPGFIQSNYGAPGNFEIVVRTADSHLNHWWRDGSGWHDGGRFGANIALSGPSLIQSHYGAAGNFELVAVLNNGQMQHWWRDNDHGMLWHSSVAFGSGISSPPCMIEGEFGAANERSVGNFELCVAVNGQVQHWWRANGSDMLWRTSASFGHDVRAVVSLVEGSYGFNLEVIVLRTDNQLQHYWRDGGGWHEGVVFGSI